MSMTENTYKALDEAMKLAASSLKEAEEFWESRGLNPTVVESVARRLTATDTSGSSSIRFEMAMMIGFAMAQHINDPSFGLPLHHQHEKHPGGVRDPKGPHEFERFGRNSNCSLCGRPEAWHLHTDQHTDDLRGDADR